MTTLDSSDHDFDSNQRGGLARFFGVIVDPKTYGALVYMMLAMGTGIFYFTWVVTGLSVSVGTLILIVGIPLALLFLASVRVLSYFEGFIAQGLLGANLVRDHEPLMAQEGEMSDEGRDEDTSPTLGMRIKTMLADARTWTSMVYMVLQLGLGIVYFTFVVVTMTISVSFIVAPLAEIFLSGHAVMVDGDSLAYLNEHMPWLATIAESPYASLVLVPIGLSLLFVSLHVVRGVGAFHRRIAETLLVRRG